MNYYCWQSPKFHLEKSTRRGKCVKSHAKIDDFSSTLTKSTPQSMIFRRNSSISISTRRKWLRQNARQNGWFFVAKRTSNSISFKCLPFIAIKTLEHAKIDYLELYLYDRALKSEAVKPPSTYREPLKNRCRNVSKIIEKRRLATSTTKLLTVAKTPPRKVETPKVIAAKSTRKSMIFRRNSSIKISTRRR